MRNNSRNKYNERRQSKRNLPSDMSFIILLMVNVVIIYACLKIKTEIAELRNETVINFTELRELSQNRFANLSREIHELANMTDMIQSELNNLKNFELKKSYFT